MHEDSLAMARKVDIHFPRQVARMQAVTIAQPVKHATDNHFWTGIGRPNRLHNSSALFGCSRIGHPYPARSFAALKRIFGFLSCT